MESLKAIFGARLRVIRKARGMTLEQLGRAAGIGYKHVAEIERGAKSPSFELVERLCTALAVDPYDLFLPTHLPVADDRSIRLLVREIEQHGTPEARRFLCAVLQAARDMLPSRRRIP